MSRDPFQPQDLQLVAPRRGCWNEGLGRESDQFRKAVRGKEGDIRKCFVSLLGESVVPELDSRSQPGLPRRMMPATSQFARA
jgi:hypothetical protein